MSSIWTPGGERPVGNETPAAASGPQDAAEPSQEEIQAQMEELRKQLTETPAEIVIANHCFGLFELAALHLGNQPPNLTAAQLAIDALGALVDGLSGRLGEPEAQLKEGLNQLRLAFVQIRSTAENQPPAN